RPTRTCLNAARARTVLTTPLREAVTRDLRAESLAITTPRKVAAIDVAGSANAIAPTTATASRRALFTVFCLLSTCEPVGDMRHRPARRIVHIRRRSGGNRTPAPSFHRPCGAPAC